MKVDKRFHCFGCGAVGDVIDFTAQLYGLDAKSAAEKLAADFQIPYTHHKRKETVKKAIREKSEEKMYRELEARCFRVLSDYFHLLRHWERAYAPKPEDETWHPLFVEALQKKDHIEYLLDVLLYDSVEERMFSVKDARFKQEGFVAEVKEFYTGLINRYISDPEQQIKVFDPQSVYLPTKKIGRNNPKAEEIKADNAARQEWNRTADMALLTGISEAEILEVKQAEIHEKVRQSIHQAGWLPHLFRAIVGKARAFLQGLIRQRAMPPKPTLDIDMAEFRAMRGLMIRVRDEATSIRYLQEDVLPDLKQQLAAATGIFKTRERKDIAGQIQQTEQEISHRMDALPSIVQAEGYPDVQTFTATYRKAEAVVSQHNRELAEWERKVQERQRPAVKERPPEPRSVRERLRRLQDEGKRQQPQPHRRAVDRDSR